MPVEREISVSNFEFHRLVDGSVTIVFNSFKDNMRVQETIPAETWAKIVAALSIGGNTDARHGAALEFHSLPDPVTVPGG